MADNQIKLVMLGSGGVGKSALVIRLVNDNFLEGWDPTIEDRHHHQMVVDQKECHLTILDTAGQQDFHAMEDQWFQLGEGFVLVYSITSKSSFIEIGNTYERLTRSKEVPPPVLLCGNKSDLGSFREVPTADGTRLAARWGCPFFETSAKMSRNEDVFAELVRLCFAKKTEKPEKPTKTTGCCVLL
jgi:small GTP-binding protein